MSKFVAATKDLIINLDTVTHVQIKPTGEMDVYIVGREKPVATVKGKLAEQLRSDLDMERFRMAT